MVELSPSRWRAVEPGRPLAHRIDKATGEVHESHTMLTLNADLHPLMSRMHKPDPKLPSEISKTSGRSSRSRRPTSISG